MIDTLGGFFLAEKVEVALGVHFCTCTQTGMHDSCSVSGTADTRQTHFVNCHNPCFSVSKHLFDASDELAVGHS